VARAPGGPALLPAGMTPDAVGDADIDRALPRAGRRRRLHRVGAWVSVRHERCPRLVLPAAVVLKHRRFGGRLSPPRSRWRRRSQPTLVIDQASPRWPSVRDPDCGLLCGSLLGA